MTATQIARTVGFRVSLAARGVNLAAGAASIKALIEQVGPDNDQFQVARETTNSAIVHVLRGDLAELGVNVGSVLTSEDGLVRYRVTRIEDNPANIALRLHCDLAPTS